MLAYIERIIPNDGVPDFEFIEVRVVFGDDERSPHNRATVEIFLRKDDKMTTDQIVEAAISHAHSLLSRLAQIPPTGYRRSRSFLLDSDLREDKP
jgi:hypothetical protein